MLDQACELLDALCAQVAAWSDPGIDLAAAVEEAHVNLELVASKLSADTGAAQAQELKLCLENLVSVPDSARAAAVEEVRMRLVAWIEDLRQAGRKCTMRTDEDGELVGDFVIEAKELIEAAEEAMLDLARGDGASDAVHAVFRAMHSLKGTAGFLELHPIQELAHVAESVLDRVRSGEVVLTPSCADLLLMAIDTLRALLAALAEAGPGVDIPIVSSFEGAKRALQTELERDDADLGPVSDVAEAQPVQEANLQPGSEAAQPHGRPRSDDSTIRIPSERVEALLNAVGELLVAYSMVGEDAGADGSARSEIAHRLDSLGARIRTLQAISVEMRLVRLKKTFSHVGRLVYDLTRKLGKPADLVVDGADTEIDRTLVETLYEPLVHLLRNALDHGLEPAEQRRAAGKPARGQLTLRAQHVSGNVVIEVGDDGKGLDPAKIRSKAVERGLIAADAHLSDQDTFELIFAPGFSTAAAVSNVSGRGVGMDVVKKKIESIHGRVGISSTLGKGTRVSLSVPLTTAISDAMLVWVGEERFLIPTRVIRQSFKPEPDSVSNVTGKGEMVRLRDDYLPVLRVHELLEVPAAVVDPAAALMVHVESEREHWALMVDRVAGQRQVVVKATGLSPQRIPAIAGGAILGDGKVALALDASALVRLASERRKRRAVAA